MTIIKFKGLLLTITMLILSVLNLSAQSCIEGMVLDASNGKPLPGASIAAGSKTGTIAGRDGSFSLCGLQGDSVNITVSYVGYQTVYKTFSTTATKIKINLRAEVSEIEAFVVTATRTDSRIINTPVRINQLGPELIESLPAQSVDEVLKMAPGINFSRSFGILSTKATVTMRGMSGKEQGRVLILVDGIPMNKSDGGGFDWNLVDMGMVQKIEVTKGAGSAIYGGNAMGGIVNIITQKPTEKFFVKAGMEYGSFNTAGGKLSFGGSINVKKPGDSWTWMANTFYRQSDGYITQSDADVNANPYIVKSNLLEAGAGFRSTYSFNGKHSIGVSINFYDDNRGTGEKVFQPEGNTTEHDSYGATLNYKGHLGQFSLLSSAYFLNEDYKKVNEYLKDDYTWYEVLSTRRDFGWLTSITRPIGTSHKLTAGFDLKNGSVDAWDKYYTSTDIVYNAGKMNTWSLFLQDEIGLLQDKIRILAGLRYDIARFYDGSFYTEAPTQETAFMHIYQNKAMSDHVRSALSPRLSAHYRWSENNRIYAGYSRGFRPAVLDDMCRSGRIKGGFKVASPDLRPEYLNNFEAGFDLNPFNAGILQNFSLEASAFYSRGSDFQYYVTNGQTIDMGFGDRPILIRANISEVEIYGAELSFNYQINSSLSVYGGYAFADALILDYTKIALNDTIDLSGKTMTDVPRNIITAGVTLLNRYVNTGLSFRYTGSMYINDQNTVDELLNAAQYPAHTSVDLKFWKPLSRHFRLSLNIQNIFDVKIYDSKYNVGPGRFITAGVSFGI
ncbi:MAG: iron complex outermembrane recepter [Bacteroidetes bacterium]|nr:MAG: iron complex outermembrane recepter [Bacteroidota bacterium]